MHGQQNKIYKIKILQFQQFMVAARKKMSSVYGQVSFSNFQGMSKKDVAIRGVQTSGHEKTPYTAVLAFCANGTKLSQLLLYKTEIMPSIKIERGIVIHIHMKGWMTESGTKMWLEKTHT
jgi:hypothetical protein